MKDPDILTYLTKEQLVERVHALESQIADRKKTEQLVTKTASKGILRILAGGHLYTATKNAYTAWLSWIRSDKKDDWPEEEMGSLVASVVARLFRVGVIGLLVALIPAVTVVFQTFILSNQNRHFESQNAFIAFEQTTKFRELLFKLPVDSLGREVENWEELPDSLYTWQRPDQSVVDQLRELGAKETETVHKALEPLLTDRSNTVAVGAIEVLSRLGVYINAYEANIARANLNGIDLTRAFLELADLSGSYLVQANLSGTDLSGADLSGSYLDQANLSGTDLAFANLSGASLSHANFSGADLNSADLSEADLTSIENLTINQLCQAHNLTEIKTFSLTEIKDSTLINFKDFYTNNDSLLNLVKETCPDKINPPSHSLFIEVNPEE